MAYVNKASALLELFLKPNFKVINENSLVRFLQHLLSQIKDAPNKDAFLQWLNDAFTLWHIGGMGPPNVLILNFALKLATVISEHEELFVKLNSRNIYEKIVVVQLQGNNCETTIESINLFCSFLSHKSGLQWILATPYWIRVMELGRKSQSTTIRKKSSEFVCKLMLKTMTFNHGFCVGILIRLLKPLREIMDKCNSNKSVEHIEVDKVLKPHLLFTSEVFDAIALCAPNSMMSVFSDAGILDISKELLDFIDNEDLSFEILKIPCTILILLIANSGERLLNALEHKSKLGFLSCAISKNHLKSALKMSHHAHILFGHLKGQMPCITRKGHLIEFQNQFLLLQLIPIIFFFSASSQTELENTLYDVYPKEYMKSIFNISSIRIIELAFQWKEKLSLRSDKVQVVTCAVAYLMKTKSVFDKKRAVICFQSLVYALQKTIALIKEQNGVNLTSNYVLLVGSLIDAVIDLVQTFDLTWNDSIVTISIMSIAYEFLQIPYWNEQLMISGFMLLNLTISKYMSPDLVLLIDHPKESLMSFIGNMLYAKCQDVNCNIREAALENVHTLSVNAISKFPSYTRILLAVKLPELVLHTAFGNEMACVRAAAFRCLQALIQIEEVWDVLLHLSPDFLDTVMRVLERFGTSDDLVRMETVKLLQSIYKHQGFPAALLPRVYDLMSPLTINDPHSDVRVNGLQFWVDVLDAHLTNQGMLDRKFPEVTFSKELRKIVTLNTTEVRRRILKVLNQMSRIGCLQVLKCACLDTHLQVSRKATEAAKLIVDLCEEYNVPYDNNYTVECYEMTKSRPASPCNSSTITASDCYDFDFAEMLTCSDPIHQVGPLQGPKMVNAEQTGIDQFLDDIIRCNNAPILQEMDTEMGIERKSVYLAPSDFLQFAFEFRKDSLNEAIQDDDIKFTSLLEGVLQEYDIK